MGVFPIFFGRFRGSGAAEAAAGEDQMTRADVADGIDGEVSAAAERYAQAAFELAQEQGALEKLDSDFKTFLDAYRQNPDLRAAVNSPVIESEERAQGLAAVARKIGLSDLGVNLIGVAARNGRASDLPGIAASFSKRLARHRGAQRAEIISAAPLLDAEVKKIVDAVADALKTRVDADVFVDESLIGGFIVRVGSRQFDSSVKSKLASLKLALKSA